MFTGKKHIHNMTFFLFLLMLPSPMNQAANNLSPPRIEPSNLIEGHIGMTLLLKILADFFATKH